MRIAATWFPAGEYGRALSMWPEIAQEWRDMSHPAYCRRMESKLRELTAQGILVSSVAPLVIDEYVDWCETRDRDPADDEGRAAYAADLERLGRTIPWPPRRNAPCWCGSGLKYKTCCGSVPRASS